MNIINKLKFNNDSDLFALERDKGLKAIIGNNFNLLMEKIYILQQKKKQPISFI